MRLLTTISTKTFPLDLTPEQALAFHHRYPNADSHVLIMAADWRVNIEPGEESWFEELTSDELNDEDFLTDFTAAHIQLWMK